MSESKVATMEQRGGGIAVAVVAGLILWSLTRRPPSAEAQPAPQPTFGEGAVGEVRNLAIDVSNPIDKAPGSIVGVTGVAFDYKGPAQDIWVVWGIKPAGGLFGINFDNGAHLIERPVRAWAQASFPVPASANFTRLRPNFSGARANIAIPDPGVPQFGRDGGAAGLNFGTADVWIWMVSGAAMAGAPDFRSALTLEQNILVIDTDADVFAIIESTAAVAALSVTFG